MAPELSCSGVISRCDLNETFASRIVVMPLLPPPRPKVGAAAKGLPAVASKERRIAGVLAIKPRVEVFGDKLVVG